MASKDNIFIHLHTLDLRLHDSPSLFVAHDPSSQLSSKITHFLPVYIFDTRALDISGLPNAPPVPSSSGTNKAPRQADGIPDNPNHRTQKTRASPKSRICDMWRTSQYRLKFLLEAVYGLKESYKRSGGDMLIGYGRPEVLIPRLVEALKAESHIAGVWTQEEVTVEERNTVDHLKSRLDKLGIKLHRNDSKTLIPTSLLPFPPEQTPDVYTVFRKKVEGLGLNCEKGSMLAPPSSTATWEHGKEAEVVVSVGQKGVKLKPYPKIPDMKLEEGKGGFLNSENELDLEGMYKVLSKPLLDKPPLGGWSNSVKEGKVPKLHHDSAVPFGGSEGDALKRLEEYVGHASKSGEWEGGRLAKKYKETRNGMIGQEFSTKFSSWLSLGCLSPKEIGVRVGALMEEVGRDKQTWNNVYWILFELLWRDFFQYTSHKFYRLRKSSLFNPEGFSEHIKTYPQEERPKPGEWHYPNWDDPNDPAVRWCEGRTGVPFIDANMRELRETGWMSNRGRQNVASFLVKDLNVDWRVGAEFFEMHLVDYDTCSNWGNWQYQAGVGNDPRSSRQFNPIKQANDYDSKCEYVRLWLPELKDVPDELVQTPWLMSDKGKLGGYPSSPIVESPQWKKHYHGNRNAGRHGRDGGFRGGGGGRGRGGGGRGRGRGQ